MSNTKLINTDRQKAFFIITFSSIFAISSALIFSSNKAEYNSLFRRKFEMIDLAFLMYFSFASLNNSLNVASIFSAISTMNLSSFSKSSRLSELEVVMSFAAFSLVKLGLSGLLHNKSFSLAIFAMLSKSKILVVLRKLGTYFSSGFKFIKFFSCSILLSKGSEFRLGYKYYY